MINKIKLSGFILVMLSFLMTAHTWAADDDAYLNFGGTGQYITATALSNIQTVTIDGISAWKTGKDLSPSTYYINCKVDDIYLYNFAGKSFITVKYYDSDATGYFCLLYYSTAGTQKYSETVSLTGSNTWKTYRFALNDCAYNNGLLGNDFRITLQNASGRSGADIAFASVTCGVQSVNVNLLWNKPGNVFAGGQDIAVGLTIQNLVSSAKTCDISAVVTDKNGEEVVQKQQSVVVFGSSTNNPNVNLGTLENGFYTLDIHVVSGNEEYTFSKNISVAATGTINNANSIFGTGLHISGLTQGSDKLNSMMTLLKQSGIQSIRDEYYWDVVEKQTGVYTYYGDDYINACVNNGIEPLVVLSYSNSLYGGVPHDAAGYAGFANYAKALATHLRGKVKYFEVWNEWNGGSWSGGYGTAEYANILKATYQAVKAVDPNIQIVAGATIMADVTWFNELFSIQLDGKSTYEYCDAISYHPYCIPLTPDEKKQEGNIETNAARMFTMMKAYGTPKPQWITEIGWYTSGTRTDGKTMVSEENQANYIARTYISGMAYGVQKIFCYDFKDDGTDLNESENNYGIIHSWEDNETIPYAAKPAYLATAAVTSLLKGAQFVKEYRPRENVRMYKFFNAALNKDIIAMYTSDDSKINFHLLGNNLKLTAYDIYGNPCKITSLTGAPVYVESDPNAFDFSQITLDFRTFANATFGDDHLYDGLQVIGYETPVYYTAAGSTIARNTYQLTTADKNILLDIDDSWIYSNNQTMKISVDYFDYGTGSFYIGYKDTNGVIQKTSKITLSGAKSWKTAEFVINNADFTNSFDSADYKISTDSAIASISLIATRVRLVNTGTPILSADFDGSAFVGLNDETNTVSIAYFDGMKIMAGNNSTKQFKYVEKAGRGGVYVPAVDDGYYLSVNVPDDLIYGGANNLTVTVDYYDEGTGNFDIAFDRGNYTQMYPVNNVVHLENTCTWKTATFSLSRTWLENKAIDFRIALWTGSMTTSTQGITFGGIKVYNNKENPALMLKFDEATKAVKIYGFMPNLSENNKPVTIQILQKGKTANDTQNVDDSNVNSVVKYFGEASTILDQNYKYFEKSFALDATTGEYLVRAYLPDLNIISERTLYYFNLYDIDNLKIYDKNGAELSASQIAGVDYLDVNLDFLSNGDDTDVCMAVAVYNENGKMMGVEYVQENALAGEIRSLKTVVSLKNKINPGDKIKIFMLKNVDFIQPFNNAYTMIVK